MNYHWKIKTQKISLKAGKVAQTHLLHKFPHDAIDKKPGMCRRVSEAAKAHLRVESAGNSLLDAIGHLRPPAASAPKPKTPSPNVKHPSNSPKSPSHLPSLRHSAPLTNLAKLSPNSLKLHSRPIILGHPSWQISDDCFHTYKHHVLELPRHQIKT